MTTTESLKARMDAATERQEAARAKLIRPDGTRYYSDEEHKERERGIAREFEAEMDRVETGIEECIERAQGNWRPWSTATPPAASPPKNSNAPPR